MSFEEDFKSGKKKKSVLWGKVLEEIKKVDFSFPFSKEEITRKFLNISITYKRIKKRNKESGRDVTCWDFFDMMDEVYGTRHSLDPPREYLIDSLETPDRDIQTEDDLPRFDSQISSPSTPSPSTSNRRNKRRKVTQEKENEILIFLQEEAKKDDQRHKELMEAEKQRLQIETERNEELRDLKNILREILQSNT